MCSCACPAKRLPWRKILNRGVRHQSEGGIILRGRRHKEGISQVNLAKEISISQHHISEMENGKRVIGNAMAKRLAEYFDTDYRVFL